MLVNLIVGYRDPQRAYRVHIRPNSKAAKCGRWLAFTTACVKEWRADAESIDGEPMHNDASIAHKAICRTPRLGRSQCRFRQNLYSGIAFGAFDAEVAPEKLLCLTYTRLQKRDARAAL